MASGAMLRRSLLYVPGSSRRFLEKSSTLSSADCIIYDLEDAVTPANKAPARNLVREAIDTRMPSIRERGVRINSVLSGLALPDLQRLADSPSLTTIVLPKCDGANDVTFVRDVLGHLRAPSLPRVSVIALVESAKSLLNLDAICRAAPGLLSGLAFAAEDFALDIGARRSASMVELLLARSSVVAAARAHGLRSALDLVAMGYKGDGERERLEVEAGDGRSLGFNGKQCIHPGQVDVVNAAFSPGRREVEWAVMVVLAQEEAEARGRGAWTLDGKMIDRPVEDKAREIVSMAGLCGLDVEALMRKHASQEPE